MATFLVRALDLPQSPAVGFTLTDDDKTLVARYHVLRKQDGVDIVYTDDMQYWPRGLDKGLDIEPDPGHAQLVSMTNSAAGSMLDPGRTTMSRGTAAKRPRRS